MNREKEIWLSLNKLKTKLKLSEKDLMILLRVEEKDFQEWKKNKKIPIFEDNVFAFISIGNSLNRIFKTGKEQIEWLNSVHPKFGISPLDFIKKSEHNILNLQMYLNLIT
jgi:hypothetical protein